MTDRAVRAPRGDIQGMRALAVLLVIAAHAGISEVAGGYVGVDVFFVISGFLITGILARSIAATGTISIAAFYARRARRILPAAAVVLVAISVGSALVYTTGRLNQVLTDVTWATFFAANLNYASAGTGYFDNDQFVSPVQHFWSLAVEEQFYLVWPLLLSGCAFLAVRLVRRTHGAGDATAPGRRVALRYATLVIAAICLASVLWSRHDTLTAPTSAYFSTFTRAFELGAGALVALCSTTLARLAPAAKALCSWAGLGAVMVAAVAFTDATPFPGLAALLPVSGAALLLVGGIDGPGYGATWLIARQPLRWVGDISYSLYLWHWPWLILPAAWLGRSLRPVETGVVVTLAVLAAWLSFRFVEQPFRQGSAGDAHHGRALLLWPVGLAVVLASVGGVWAQNAWRDSERPAYALPNVDPEPGTRQTSSDPLINDVGFAAELTRHHEALPARLMPAMANLFSDVTSGDGYQNDDSRCSANNAETHSDLCTQGDVRGSRTIVALGDSHMGMWLAPVTKLAREHGYRVIPMIKQRCLPVPVLPNQKDATGAYTECLAYQAWTLEQVRRIKPDLVVLSGLYTVTLVDEKTGAILPRPVANGVFEAAARKRFGELARLAGDVLVIGPTPALPRGPSDCFASRHADMGSCQAPLRGLIRVRDQALQRAASASSVRYARMLPWFCDKRGTCPIVVRNRLVYRDANHITETYAERLQPVIEDFLDLRSDQPARS